KPMGQEYDKAINSFAWNIPVHYNLGKALCRRSARDRRSTAIIEVEGDFSEASYSFDFLDNYSNRLSNLLFDSGCSRGDRIAVLLPASVAAAVAHLAILKAGMVCVPMLLDGADVVTQRLHEVAASAVITSASMAEVHASDWRQL